MKRFLSLLLSCVLLFGLLPGAVLANVQDEPGYLQMYCLDNGRSRTDRAIFSRDTLYELQLALSENGDPISGDAYTVYCDTSLGVITPNAVGKGFRWDASAFSIEGEGAQGYIYAYATGNDAVIYRLSATRFVRPYKLYDAPTGGTQIPAGTYDYTVNYTANPESPVSVYFRMNDTAVNTAFDAKESRIISATPAGRITGERISDTLYAVTLAAGSSGQVEAQIRLKTNGNSKMSSTNSDFNIVFTDGSSVDDDEGTGERPFALFTSPGGGTALGTNGAGNYIVDYTPSSSKTYYFIPTGNSKFGKNSFVSYTGQTEPSPITYTISEDCRVLAVTVAAGCTGEAGATLSFVIDGERYQEKNNIFIFFKPAGSSGNMPPQGGQPAVTLRSPAHTVTEADKCNGFVLENYLNASFNVKYDGKTHTVYMVPGRTQSASASFGGSDEWTFSQEELDSGRLIDVDRGVGFFLPKDGGGTDRIADPAFIAAIKEKIGNSLRLDVYTYEDKTYPIAAEFPAVYDLSPDTDRSFANVRLKLGMEHRGYYVFRATCTVGGKTLVSESRLEWRPTIEAVYQFGQDTTVAEINAYLDAYTDYSDYTTLVLKLPAKELYGYIDIPAKAGRSYVELRGAERVNGQPTTILHGGFTTSNFSARAENIAFVGAGRGIAKWPSVNGSAGVNADRPNCAVYDYTVFHGGEPTMSGSHCENCTFTGYNTAINTVMRLRTAANCYFVENDVAMRFNTDINDGGGGMGGNKFLRNGVAIHFDYLHEDFPTSWFQLKNTVFIDNEIDIQNDLKNGSQKRNIFIPAAFFGYTAQGGSVVARECNSGKPDVSNSANNRVFAYPQAAEPDDFDNLIYSPAFYVSSKDKGPIFSSNLAASYPLPQSVLSGNTFRILDESTGKIVKVKF